MTRVPTSASSAAWRALALGLALCGMAAAGCATATAPMPAPEPAGAGPFQRFIVRYRDGSDPARAQGQVPARLARTAAAAKLSPAPVLRWQRRLAVQADVFVVDRPLDRDEAATLMHAFAADPDVEYIEVDQMMGIGPQPQAPMREGD
jgi:serine protease